MECPRGRLILMLDPVEKDWNLVTLLYSTASSNPQTSSVLRAAKSAPQVSTKAVEQAAIRAVDQAP